MNYTTAGTVPFSIKFKQDKKSLDRCRSSFSNQSTTSSNSSKSVSSFSSATNYSCQRSNNNNSSSKLHKSPRCFDDLNQLLKWIIRIIVLHYLNILNSKYGVAAKFCANFVLCRKNFQQACLSTLRKNFLQKMELLQNFVQTLACVT